MLFKTCYCLDLWKYNKRNYAFSDVRLEQYYSNAAECCQQRGGVCASTASRLTGFTDLANTELFLQNFFCCAITGTAPHLIATDGAFVQTNPNILGQIYYQNPYT